MAVKINMRTAVNTCVSIFRISSRQLKFRVYVKVYVYIHFYEGTALFIVKIGLMETVPEHPPQERHVSFIIAKPASPPPEPRSLFVYTVSQLSHTTSKHLSAV